MKSLGSPTSKVLAVKMKARYHFQIMVLYSLTATRKARPHFDMAPLHFQSRHFQMTACFHFECQTPRSRVAKRFPVMLRTHFLVCTGCPQ